MLVVGQKPAMRPGLLTAGDIGSSARYAPQVGPRSRQRRRRPPPRDDLANNIGAYLRELRLARGLSQANLGAPYFTRAHISAIELGKILPTVNTLAHFARKLKLPLREVLPPHQ